ESAGDGGDLGAQPRPGQCAVGGAQCGQVGEPYGVTPQQCRNGDSLRRGGAFFLDTHVDSAPFGCGDASAAPRRAPRSEPFPPAQITAREETPAGAPRRASFPTGKRKIRASTRLPDHGAKIAGTTECRARRT